MNNLIKPQMAYPAFASATYTFSPSKWPVADDSATVSRRFEANARTAAGQFIRHTSPLNERTFSISYSLLTDAERDSFAAPDGTGFFNDVGGEQFEYRHTDGTIYKVRFLSDIVESRFEGHERWSLAPIVMVVVSI
ncbi:hypothetical protein MNBD_NITROSPINAE04-1959 [hydrothermal vent metagenome]|uniref:Uncharacterized protein n=1 Tax=hydrothermal vent metagenome TaxID=652676 RepID=A0A3B1BAP0_9ZZZZ